MTDTNKSLFKQVLTWTVVGFIALLALKLVFRLLGWAFGVVAFLAFTIGPIVLIGWLTVKAWNAFTRAPVKG